MNEEAKDLLIFRLLPKIALISTLFDIVFQFDIFSNKLNPNKTSFRKLHLN